MEIVRSVKITVEVDTNKATSTEEFTRGELETTRELLDRVQLWIEEQYGVD